MVLTVLLSLVCACWFAVGDGLSLCVVVVSCCCCCGCLSFVDVVGVVCVVAC